MTLDQLIARRDNIKSRLTWANGELAADLNDALDTVNAQIERLQKEQEA